MMGVGAPKIKIGKKTPDVNSKNLPKVKPRLSRGIADTFEGGVADRIVLEKPLVLYRVHGNKAGKVGRFLTDKIPQSRRHARQGLALKQEWEIELVNLLRWSCHREL
jgi:ribosomal protein S30